MQTAVCMLIVLGPKHRPQIEPEVQENWFLSYLGNQAVLHDSLMLDRYSVNIKIKF